MQGLKDFKYSNDKHIDLFFVNCEETPYTRKQLLSEMPTFISFMERFNCSLDELCEILDMYGIRDSDLFEYTITAGNYPVARKYIYTVKYVQNGWHGQKRVETYYDVYLTCNQYVTLSLNTVANELIKRRFPYLAVTPFTKIEKRFKDSIKNLPKTLLAKVSNLNTFMLFENDLTIGDLIKLYTEGNYADIEIEKPLYSVYSEHGDIYITLDENKGGWTLNLSYSILANKDWKAIEDKHVFSICLYDENGEQIKGKWFEGKQKDAPYFNHPLVKELKKIMLNVGT